MSTSSVHSFCLETNANCETKPKNLKTCTTLGYIVSLFLLNFGHVFSFRFRETPVPSSRGIVKQCNQELCISWNSRCFTKRLQSRPSNWTKLESSETVSLSARGENEKRERNCITTTVVQSPRSWWLSFRFYSNRVEMWPCHYFYPITANATRLFENTPTSSITQFLGRTGTKSARILSLRIRTPTSPTTDAYLPPRAACRSSSRRPFWPWGPARTWGPPPRRPRSGTTWRTAGRPPPARVPENRLCL